MELFELVRTLNFESTKVENKDLFYSLHFVYFIHLMLLLKANFDWLIFRGLDYKVSRTSLSQPEEDKDIHIISFKLNEVAALSDPGTWFNFITRMPDSVSLKAKGNAQPGGHSSGKFTITNKVEEFDHIVIIIGTKANFTERVLKKGEVLEEKINYWRTQFAIVDSTNGYDSARKSYRTQRFIASEEISQLEIKFWSYQNGGKIGEFRVWNQATGKKLEGKSQNYKNVEHEPSEDIKKAIEQYKKWSSSKKCISIHYIKYDTVIQK